MVFRIKKIGKDLYLWIGIPAFAVLFIFVAYLIFSPGASTVPVKSAAAHLRCTGPEVQVASGCVVLSKPVLELLACIELTGGNKTREITSDERDKLWQLGVKLNASKGANSVDNKLKGEFRSYVDITYGPDVIDKCSAAVKALQAEQTTPLDEPARMRQIRMDKRDIGDLFSSFLPGTNLDGWGQRVYDESVKIQFPDSPKEGGVEIHRKWREATSSGDQLFDDVCASGLRALGRVSAYKDQGENLIGITLECLSGECWNCQRATKFPEDGGSYSGAINVKFLEHEIRVPLSGDSRDKPNFVALCKKFEKLLDIGNMAGCA